MSTAAAQQNNNEEPVLHGTYPRQCYRASTLCSLSNCVCFWPFYTVKILL